MTRAIVIGSGLGRLLLTISRQAAGAPIIDHANGDTADGRNWTGRSILPPRLWLRPKAERPPTRALSIGWTDR